MLALLLVNPKRYIKQSQDLNFEKNRKFKYSGSGLSSGARARILGFIPDRFRFRDETTRILVAARYINETGDPGD